MKKIFIYLILLSYITDTYSMKNNTRLEATIQETIEIFAQEVCTFQASIDAKNYIKTLTPAQLNQLTYSIEEDCITLVEYKKQKMIVNRRKKGFSLVHVAINKDLWWLINALKEQGAHLTLRSLPEAGSLTPLKLAYQQKHWQCVKALLMAGVNSQNDPFVLDLIHLIQPQVKDFSSIWMLLKKVTKSNL